MFSKVRANSWKMSILNLFLHIVATLRLESKLYFKQSYKFLFIKLLIRSLYRSGSLKTVARELGKYKLDLVGVQEVRWDKGGTERAEDYTFF
jgi:hypothetical protein